MALLRTIGFFVLCYLFYSLIENHETYFLMIYSLIAVVVILGYRMILDVFTLGPQLYFARVFETVVQLLDEKVQHKSPTFGSIAQSTTRSLLSSVFLGFSIQIVFNHLYYREIMSHKFLCVLLEPTVQKTTVKT